MNSKIIIFAIFYICLQVSNCETIDDVLAELTPKVTQTQLSINSKILSERQRLGEVKTQIQLAVNTANKQLNNQLNKLYDNIKKYQQDAGSNPNILTCISMAEISLKGLDLNSIEYCTKSNNDLSMVEVQIRTMETLNEQLGNSISVCLSQNPTNPAGLRTCINNQIITDLDQSNILDSMIRSTLDGVLSKVQDCINNTLNNLIRGINQINTDLSTCVINA